jgi:hypothetical protein
MVRSGPLTSTAPRVAPVSGSCTGAATQVHEWYVRTRCSAEWICTGASTASVVPIALVPMAASLQLVPGNRPTRSAGPSSSTAPSRQRTWPAASVTSTRCTASSAMPTRLSRIRGMTAPSGWAARMSRSSSGACTTGGVRRSGSTRAARLRSQEADTTGRGARRTGPLPSTASKVSASCLAWAAASGPPTSGPVRGSRCGAERVMTPPSVLAGRAAPACRGSSPMPVRPARCAGGADLSPPARRRPPSRR